MAAGWRRGPIREKHSQCSLQNDIRGGVRPGSGAVPGMHLALDLRDGLRQRLITSPRLALIAGWAYTPFGARLRTRAGMRPHGAGVGEPAIWSGSRDTVLAALNSSGWCPNGGAPVWAANKAEWAEAAQFFARVIAAGTSYISHGEMQTGLSLDGKTWAPGLEQRFLAGLGSFDGTRGLAIVRGACGKIVAPANVTWCFETADAPFAPPQLGHSNIDWTKDEALKEAAAKAKPAK
jgi:hypothetical protein